MTPIFISRRTGRAAELELVEEAPAEVAEAPAEPGAVAVEAPEAEITVPKPLVVGNARPVVGPARVVAPDPVTDVEAEAAVLEAVLLRLGPMVKGGD